jgi:hypothetical protein
VLLEGGAGGFGELLLGLRRGLEQLEQSERLVPHGLLDQSQLMQPAPSKDGLKPNTRGRDATLSTGSLQRGSQLWSCQTSRFGWRGRDRQNGAGIWVGKPAWPSILEGFEESGKVVG